VTNDDDEIFEGEIVDDPNGELTPLVSPDTILTPCHHGCTCGLHQQVVYGERVPLHPPAELDHGEMALLVEAAGDATQMLSGFHDHFRQLCATATRTHGQARRALHELAGLLHSNAVGKARAARDRVETEYADLTPAERQPAPRWLKVAAVAAVLGMGIFDAYFFQQTFLIILQVQLGDSWWKQDIGLVAAVVLAIGLVAAGRVLAGPIWRLGRRWRGLASPDDKPPGAMTRTIRILAVGGAPALTFFVLGWWASLRGQAAAAAQVAADQGKSAHIVFESFPIMLLLLSLALTVVVLELLVYNPYQTDVRRAERSLAKVRKRVITCSEEVAEAIDAHEIAWRDLRSTRDEVISFVQAALARPWQTVILPARLRHGKAGPTPVGPKSGVKIEMPAVGAVNGESAGADQVRITYQIFEGVPQPQPGPGPLAEAVRAVLDLSPEDLRRRQRRLEEQVITQLSQEVPPGKHEEDAA
jgi:hypothetical protein